jgi:hypothetical protein
MKSRLALAALLALPLALTAMPTAVEYLPGVLNLKHGVRLVDGSVLPAGRYDVQIHYKGWGNAAEFHFFTGGVFKGKTSAEARGFAPSAPAAVGGTGGAEGIKKSEAELKKVDPATQKGDYLKIEDIKGESADAKHKNKIDVQSAASFSWGAAGFRAGALGNDTLSGNGRVKISFDSSNSAAGFSAILPYVEKKGK